MNLELFHKLMNKWVSKQIDSAPDLRPSDELYDAVRSNRKKPSKVKFPVSIRWGAGIAAAAAIAFVLFLQTDIFRYPIDGGGLIPSVGIRPGYSVSPDAKKRGPEHGKGPGDSHVGRGEIIFDRLEFQYQKFGSEGINGVYVRVESPDTVKLSAEDNYRLSVELRHPGYLYIYQLSSDSSLVQLFSDDDFSFLRNPLAESQRYLVPSPPDWFHVDNNTGLETIYFAWSENSLPEWDELYELYIESKSSRKHNKYLDILLESFANPPEKIVLHTFIFENQ